MYNSYIMKNLSLTLFQNSLLLKILVLCSLCAGALYLLYHFVLKKREDDGKLLSDRDLLWILLITGMYAVVSLTHLGSLRFPVTTWQPSTTGQEFILELTESTHFDRIHLIYGEGDNNALDTGYQIGVSSLAIQGSDDASSWQDIWHPDSGQIYEYSILECDWDYRYLRITSVDPRNTITELGVRAFGEDRFLPLSVYRDDHADSAYPASLIIDEQDILVTAPTHYDEAYFDEVYHVRNAWEIANGQTMYATVHPLLGTNLMALFIRLFGLRPFVWRLPGALCGIAMIPLLYIILKKMFADTFLSVFGTVLLAADFMHLTTSRIGTLEPFSMITILWMFYEMLKYCRMDHFTVPLRNQLLQLLKCGIAMGIAIAVKWTACYSAVGLAVLLFTRFFLWYRTYRKARGHTGPYAQAVRTRFPSMLWITIAWCFVFFIFIPIVIYWAAYLPDRFARVDWSIRSVWDQTMYIYRYHSELEAAHPFQSAWYQWIFDIRPIWYYFRTDPAGTVESISCFSHPLLAWGGTFCTLTAAIFWFDTKDDNAWTALVMILTAILPWAMLVGRCAFAYHFYPTSVFMILAIVCTVSFLLEDAPHLKGLFSGILVLYVLIFLAFLPATAGHTTTLGYLHALEWFSTWSFG